MKDRASIDTAAAWDALPPDVQRQLGSIALGLALAQSTLDDLNPTDLYDTEPSTADSRRLEAAETQLFEALSCTLHDCVPGVADMLGRHIDLNGVGIRMCTACGCTDDVACDGGCSWAGPTLCSACRDNGYIGDILVG